MAGIGRLEHPLTVLETAALPVKLYPYDGDACGTRTQHYKLERLAS